MRFDGWIQEDFSSGGVFRPRIESGRLDLAHFGARVAGATLDVLFGHAFGVLVARLADVVEVDSQKASPC
jgi:hypothetical protein